MKLTLRPVRTLDLAPSPGGPSWLAAASGLVKLGPRFVVAPDDELGLGFFSASPDEPGRIHPLREGKLSSDHKERKKAKPDWEALLALPREPGTVGDRVLTIPSGSKPNRMTGDLVEILPTQDALQVEPIDFSALYSKLSETFASLNVEGAAIRRESLFVFQRGNGTDNANAVIEIDLSIFTKELASRSITHACLKGVSPIELGHLQSVPLGFTDAHAKAEWIWFLAAAEDTASTYDDGEYKGAVLGRLSRELNVELFEIDCPMKPEGLWVEDDLFYVVTDADDSSKPALLLVGDLP